MSSFRYWTPIRSPFRETTSPGHEIVRVIYTCMPANYISLDLPENVYARAGLMRNSESTNKTIVPTWLDPAKYHHSHILLKSIDMESAVIATPARCHSARRASPGTLKVELMRRRCSRCIQSSPSVHAQLLYGHLGFNVDAGYCHHRTTSTQIDHINIRAHRST